MSWLFVSLVLTSPAPSSSAQPWRLVSTPLFHLGARPAMTVSSDEIGIGATVQVTAWIVTL